MGKLVYVGMISALLAGACSGTAIDEQGQPLPPDDSEMPAQMTDSKGITWTRVGKVTAFEAEDGDAADESASVARSSTRPPVAERSLEDLAHQLRGKRFVNGYEYVSGPNYELARMVKAPPRPEAATPTPMPMPQAEPDAPLPEILVGQDIFDGDQRQRIRTNTSFPFSALVALQDGGGGGGCSGTMVGPSTMLTAAHCVHTGTGWKSPRTWAPAVDSQDANPTPWLAGSSTFPTAGAWVFQCYAVTIPGGWDSGKDVEDDYAVIEFSNAGSKIGPLCNLFPGNQVGWLGLWHAGESQVENGRLLYGYGYPGNTEGCPGGSCSWPQIWGIGTGYIDVHQTWHIDHHTDSTGGQSGMGLYILEGTGRYLVGIHKGSHGFPFNDNYGRRVTDTLLSWMASNSAYRPANPFYSYPSR
jgi:V8-like Glu-specific endopeptidase